MIRYKLHQLKLEALNNKSQNKEKIEAIISIQKLLNKIDFEFEVVPLTNYDKLKNLLTSINHNPINEIEKSIVKIITKK